MKRIAKTDVRLYRTAYGIGPLLMAVPFLSVGGYFALAGFGAFPLPGKLHGPLWLVADLGVAFFAAGALLAFHSLRGLNHRRRMRLARQRFGDIPWVGDYPWDPRGIGDSPAGRWVGQLAAAVMLGLLLLPINWWGFYSGEGPWPVKLVAGLFDLVWLLVVMKWLYTVLQFLKFGHSRLGFEHFPFAPGETMRLSLTPNQFEALTVTLRFVEERFESSGRGRRRHASQNNYQHYSEVKQLRPPAAAPAVALEFQLPDNPQWVTQLTANPTVRYWELVVEAAEPGIDFRTTFPLPVYPRMR